MQITFADNKTYDLIVVKGKGEIVISPEDTMSKAERDIIELHFDSTKYDTGELQKYFVNADEYTHTFTLTDDIGASFVHTDYVIKLKYGLDYVNGEANPRIILRLGQLTETDKTLRQIAGKVKVYTGTELEVAIAKTCDLMSENCRSTIEAGIDFNGEHYSLTSQDQTNILCWRGVASSGSAVPYHADGEHCRMYTAEEFIGLSSAAIAHITHNTTYCNLLMRWIETLTNVEEIYEVAYGQTELPEEYYEEYVTVMTAIGVNVKGEDPEESEDENIEVNPEDTPVEDTTTSETPEDETIGEDTPVTDNNTEVETESTTEDNPEDAPVEDNVTTE